MHGVGELLGLGVVLREGSEDERDEKTCVESYRDTGVEDLRDQVTHLKGAEETEKLT